MKFHPILEAWCTAIRVNEFQKIIISSNLFKYLKAKKQGFYLTPIRIIIMHELLLRKYGTNISRSNFLKVVKGNFGLELLPHGINMWTSYLVSGWGLILLIFESFLCELLWCCSSLPVTATLPFYFYNSHSYWTKNKNFQGFHIITTISTTTITTLTLQLM